MADLICAVSAERQLIVNGHVVPTTYPVREAVVARQLLVVLFDPDSDPRGYGTFPNLVAVDTDGEPRWTAALPTNSTGDCFVTIKSAEPLVALSWSSYECTIDPLTGAIERSVWLK